MRAARTILTASTLAIAAPLTSACAAQTAAAPAPAAAASPAIRPLDPAALKAFDTLVGDARTVVYGEDSHGMQRIHEVVPQLFRHLVEAKGFRVFVFEAQWALTDGLADFMASDRTELGPQESYWLNGAFASKPIAGMLVWIRDWNRRHPNDRIQLVGYQPEQPVTDFRAAFAHLDRYAAGQVALLRAAVAPCRAADTARFKTELEFITANGKYMREGKPAFSKAEREACIAGLKTLEAAVASAGPASAERRLAKLHVFSLISYYGIQRKLIDTYMADPEASVDVQRQWSADAYGNGDAARYVVYRDLQAMRFPRAKVFHWMHNWHAFRLASETDGLDGPGGAGIPKGTRSFGERLAADERGAARTIGTIVPCGADGCKDKEPDNSLEPAFATAFGDSEVVISTRDPRYVGPLQMDKPKAMLANQHRFGFRDVVLARQVDGVLYIPRTGVAQ